MNVASGLLSTLQKWKFHVATLIISVVLVELGLFGVTLAGFRDWYRHTLALDYDAYVENITDEQMRKFRENAYDPILGWDKRPGMTRETTNSAGRVVSESTDEYGARTNPYLRSAAADDLCVLAFGESFTFGAEVNNDETWPYHLSRLLDVEVMNFGVNAYGPDQALLRMKGKLAQYRADAVILGIMSENINRLMSMYRPFYQPGTAVYLGFKPMLYATESGELTMLPNPLARLESRQDVLRAYEVAKRYDYWYRVDRRPVWGFPFTLSLVRLAKYRVFDRDLAVDRSSRMREMYETREAVSKLDAVIQSVLRLAAEHDFVPVLVFIPNGSDVKDYVEQGAYSYTSYIERIRQADWSHGTRIVDVLQEEFEYERYNVKLYGAHPSSYGNSVIAAAIHKGLKLPDEQSALRFAGSGTLDGSRSAACLLPPKADGADGVPQEVD